jgi:ribosomal protein L37AE/L43A
MSNGESRRIGGERQPVNYEDFPIEALQMVHEKQAEIDALKEENAAIKKQGELVKYEAPVDQAAPVMTIQALKDRSQFICDVIGNFFEEGVHFGVPFPGSPDKMLYKVGAEWFASAFGVRPQYEQLEADRTNGETPHVYYRYRCMLVLVRTGQVIGEAVGQCSNDETKYKYRQQNYKCPTCKKETILRSKNEWGGGWYCNKNKGGCGAKYEKGAAEIENQPKPGRVLNTEVLELAHTIDAMAQKRAFVLALRGAFGLQAYIKYFEGIDDIDDDEPPQVIEGTAKPKSKPAPILAPAPPEPVTPAAESGHKPDSTPADELDAALGREPDEERNPARETPEAAALDSGAGEDMRVSADLLNSVTCERFAEWLVEHDPRATNVHHTSAAIKRGLIEMGKVPEGATWKDVYNGGFTVAEAYRAFDNHYETKAAQA